MANYSNLLATIAANIYTNNNNEVTAAMVKTAVDQMVAALGAGYQFIGLAKPSTTPSTPDYKCFYIAVQPGIYSGFNNAKVLPGYIGVFYYDSSWAFSKSFISGADSKIASIINDPVEHEVGSINALTGEDVDYPTRSRTKDYVYLLPGFLVTSDGGYFGKTIVVYDGARNYLGYYDTSSGKSYRQIKTDYPSAEYIRVVDQGSTSFRVKFALGGKLGNDKIILVDAAGGGDFYDLNEALKYAGDDATNHVTILVAPGEYYMLPTVGGVTIYPESNRNLSIIGLSKDACIIYNDIGYYNWQAATDCTPLRLNGMVSIEHLTVKSTSDQYDAHIGESGFPVGDGLRKKAYCIHKDGASQAGDIFRISDCVLIDDHFAAVGFGLRSDQELIIENCTILTEGAAGSDMEHHGAIYGHLDAGNTGLDQNLTIVDNIIVNSNTERCLALDTAAPAGATPDDTNSTLVLVRNTCKSSNLANAFYCPGLASFYIKDALCYGNNVASMNA